MTDADIRAIAKRLEADPKAMEAARWLWNAADSESVRQRYFAEMVRAVLRAMETDTVGG